MSQTVIVFDTEQEPVSSEVVANRGVIEFDGETTLGILGTPVAEVGKIESGPPGIQGPVPYVVEQGGVYPTRDPSWEVAIFVGTTDPSAFMVPGDVWINNDAVASPVVYPTWAEVEAMLDALAIDDLTDVDTITDPPNVGQALIWTGTGWTPGDVSVASALADLTDVDFTVPPTDLQTLVYDAANDVWKPGTVAGGGGGGTSSTVVALEGARLTKATTTQVVSGTYVAVPFTGTAYDTGAFFNAANPTRLTVSKARYYEVTATIYLAWVSGGQTGGDRIVELRRFNDAGVQQEVIARQDGYSVGAHGINLASGPVYMSAGDYVIAFVYQDSGGTWEVSASVTNMAIKASEVTASQSVVNADGLVLNGGLTLLKKITLSAAAASIDLTAADLPEGYDAIMVDLVCRGDSVADNISAQLNINGDTTTANYITKYLYTGTGGSDNTTATGLVPIGFFPGANGAANAFGMSRTLFSNYRSASQHKLLQCEFSMETGVSYSGKIASRWTNVAPITSLKIKPNAGNFVAGTTVAVYGVGGPGSMRTGVDPNETWKDYTPTLAGVTTNPALGTGATVEGRYSHVGNTVKGWAHIVVGATPGIGSGIYQLSIPKPMANVEPTLRQKVVGIFRAYDASTGAVYYGQAMNLGVDAFPDTLRLYVTSDATKDAIGSSYPMGGIAQNDDIYVQFEYETTEYAPVVIPVNQVRSIDDPLDPSWGPASSSDQEFNGNASVLPPGWTWLNQGTSSYVEKFGAGAISVAAGASDEWRGIIEAIPVGPSWTAMVKLSMIVSAPDAKYPSKGVVLRDSVSGKLAALHVVYNPNSDNPGVMPVMLDYYTNITTYSSRPGAGARVAGGKSVDYLRVKKNSATSWDFAVSNDGISWLPVYSGIDLSSFLTPDQIGVAANQRTLAPVLGIHWLRVR